MYSTNFHVNAFRKVRRRNTTHLQQKLGPFRTGTLRYSFKAEVSVYEVPVINNQS